MRHRFEPWPVLPPAMPRRGVSEVDRRREYAPETRLSVEQIQQIRGVSGRVEEVLELVALEMPPHVERVLGGLLGVNLDNEVILLGGENVAASDQESGIGRANV